MSQRTLRCPACRRAIEGTPADLSALPACPSCAAPLVLEILPAYGRHTQRTTAPERITGEGEASCFFHATRKAVVPCDECGRFLCGLCDVPIAGRHLCPTCLETSREKGQLSGLEKSRTRWDIVAWLMNLGLFTGIGIPIVGLLNLVFLVVGLRSKGSRVARHRVWLILASLVSLAANGALGLIFLLED